MKDFNDSKDEITLCLNYLKHKLVKNGMSIAVSNNGLLIFFKTEDYLKKKDIAKIDNFTVSIHDLVRSGQGEIAV